LEGLIPDDIVERVRSGVDIVELISERVSLKKRGANYLGLCPFHNEKTPSFTVSPAKQIFHCFGCGAGGDAVGFLIRHDNFTFPEAVRRLAERAGIEIPESTPGVGRSGKGEYEATLKANLEAAEFYSDCLHKSKEGEKARAYLKKRGITDEVAREHVLGYSPSGWDGLLGRLGKKGIAPESAEKSGLAVKRSTGQGHYDRFRDRLMFPIKDVRGRVIGFGGRTMGDDEPKYLNSPETALFKKGDTLYLIDTAAEPIRKKGYAVIVEGYMDAIACHRAGVSNAVATLGTALTPGHLRLLGRYAKKVMLVFDSDAAGLKAAERSLEVFLGTEMTAKVALLPQGDDPDSLFKREGAAGLTERLKASEGLMDFVIRRVSSGANAIEEKVAAASALTGILARVTNGVERSHYIKRSAEVLGVPESALVEELNKKLGRTVAGRPGKQAFAAASRLEEELLHLAIRYPEVAVEAVGELGPDDFSDAKLRAIAAKLFEMVEAEGEVNVPRLLDTLKEQAEKEMLLALSVRGGEYDDPAASARGSVARLLKGRVDRRLAELSRQMKEAEENKDLDLLNKLQKEFIEWQKKKS